MRGLPNFNFPAFHRAAAVLRAKGWTVFSPAEQDEQKYGAALFQGPGDQKQIDAQGFNLRSALKSDLAWIADNADVVVVLPGWEDSRGSRAEVALAQAINIPVWEIRWNRFYMGLGLLDGKMVFKRGLEAIIEI